MEQKLSNEQQDNKKVKRPEEKMCDINCELSLTAFIKISANMDELLKFLQKHNVIHSNINCPYSNQSCHLNKSYVWRCRKKHKIPERYKTHIKHCNYIRTIKTGTWFHKARLDIQTLCRLTAFHIILLPTTRFLIDEFKLSKRTIVEWKQNIRDVYLNWALEKCVDKLGGIGKIVELDLMEFGKRRYSNNAIVEGQWMFGCYERDTNNLFIIAVNERSNDTLLDIIEKRILPGTIVVSECWQWYNSLDDERFQHISANHSIHFEDEQFAQNLNIDRIWKRVRPNCARYRTKEPHYYQHFMEFYFVRTFPDHLHRIHEVFNLIGKTYTNFNDPLELT